MEKSFYVYMMASQRNGTLYIGVSSDLIQRVWQHKCNQVKGFTQKYGVHMLVYYEQHPTAESAIHQEKLYKEWKKAWKIELIEKNNPYWNDLYDEVTGFRGQATE